ncbi:MAG: hypothetical protein M0004_04455 [Actinomycetota bacterium]|nr:hypothetical protein [Actinomycetota bacterium]
MPTSGGRSAVWAMPCRASVRRPVDISPMVEGHDGDEEEVILDGRDDPVATDTNPLGGAAGERTRCRRAGVFGEQGDGTGQAGAKPRSRLRSARIAVGRTPARYRLTTSRARP